MTPKKILIVDDDGDLLHGLTLRFKANGYDVVFAMDAATAMIMAKREKPNAIILDIGLPGGDGFIVMDRLRNLNINAPIIILTARDPLDNREQALKAGAKFFFQKPVENDRLLAAIRIALRAEEVKKKILIVDDDRDLLHGLNLRFRANGYDVVFAMDAATAMIMAKREKPNAIILDIGLPGGDGFIVMDRLRKLNINAPIIILTARDPLINRERALKAGAKFFFQKPVENGKLLGALSKV